MSLSRRKNDPFTKAEDDAMSIINTWLSLLARSIRLKKQKT
jgi:hypothetical protein